MRAIFARFRLDRKRLHIFLYIYIYIYLLSKYLPLGFSRGAIVAVAANIGVGTLTGPVSNLLRLCLVLGETDWWWPWLPLTCGRQLKAGRNERQLE